MDCPRVTHPCATLLSRPKPGFLVRLACVKHAASVHSEPGSNSPVETGRRSPGGRTLRARLFSSLSSFQRSNARPSGPASRQPDQHTASPGPRQALFPRPRSFRRRPEDRSPEEPDQSIRIPASRQAFFSPPRPFSISAPAAHGRLPRPTDLRPSATLRLDPRLSAASRKKNGAAPETASGAPPGVTRLVPPDARPTFRKNRPTRRKKTGTGRNENDLYGNPFPLSNPFSTRVDFRSPKTPNPPATTPPESLRTFIYPATR